MLGIHITCDAALGVLDNTCAKVFVEKLVGVYQSVDGRFEGGQGDWRVLLSFRMERPDVGGGLVECALKGFTHGV